MPLTAVMSSALVKAYGDSPAISAMSAISGEEVVLMEGLCEWRFIFYVCRE
jgi:hypothetical protein